MKFLTIKVPRNNEYTYEQSLALFSSLSNKSKAPYIFKLLKLDKTPKYHYSFNIISINQQIYFVAATQDEEITHLSNQILAQYNNADITEMDNLEPIGLTTDKVIESNELKLAQSSYLPIKTMEEFTDVDPLSSVLSAISRSPAPDALFWMQIIIRPTNSSWQHKALSYIGSLKTATEETQPTQQDQQKATLVQEKVKHTGFQTNIRLISNSLGNLQILKGSFNVFAQPYGNSLKPTGVKFYKRKKFTEAILQHKPFGYGNILNGLELATIWHLPTQQINIPNIIWGKNLVLDPPENLPASDSFPTTEDRKNLTFFARTKFKNKDHVFGIKKSDRLRHIYIVGKTGTGKSSFIENLAVEDIRKGAGVAVLDPHGETIDHILKYIPKKRINDICYFNPADPEYAYPLNILEVPNESQRELMVSGIVAIFYKLYGHSWGPRLEYILRNTILTLSQVENTTLMDIIRILTETSYRNKLLSKIDDPVVLRFWKKEFNTLDDRQRNEQISSILNKVGQFVTSPLVRKVIRWPRSKIKITEIMNTGKILLGDLSQGKIGEDNATLLGSMLITQIQVAAMNRAFMKEEDRIPFYLYVDEFQNFATTAFTKILSEARKYKLGLTLANQYITQIDPEVMDAILGNIGTLTCFNVGAQDSEILAKEFGPQVNPEDLTNLDRYQMITRLAIDDRTSEPFTCYSLPPPKNVSGHLEKIINNSRRVYGIKYKKDTITKDNQKIKSTKSELEAKTTN